MRDWNLWLRTVKTGEERALTSDGIEGFGYGAALVSPLVGAGLDQPEPPSLASHAPGLVDGASDRARHRRQSRWPIPRGARRVGRRERL